MPARPIATVSCALIRLDPDTRRVIKVGSTTHQILSHLACNPGEAIKELKAGRDCMLDNFPGNLEAVREAFKPVAPHG